MLQEIRPPDFLMIPYQLIIDERISPLEEKLYGIIYWFQHLKDGRCIASNQTLAIFLKIDNYTCIQNGLTNLENCGYIKRIYKDDQKKKRKEIIALIAFKEVSLKNDTVSLKNDTHPKGVSLNNDENNIYNNKNINIYAPLFEEFWKEYPNKKNKKKALQSWLRIKPNNDLFKRIMGSLRSYKESDQWIKDDGKFIPHPTTWLNGERWEDEIKGRAEEEFIVPSYAKTWIK